MRIVDNSPPQTPPWILVFDRRGGASWEARQPPPCSFYLALQPGKH